MRAEAGPGPATAGAGEPAVGTALLALAVVVAPQTALAALQHSLSVLGPEITRAAGLPAEAVGLLGGLTGLGAVWFFAASATVLPVFGPVRGLIAACCLASLAALVAVAGPAALVFLAAPVIGFSYAVTAPAGSQILAGWAPQRLWGTLFSVRMAGVPLGGAISGLVGAGLAAWAGWQLGLAALAAAPLSAAGLLALAGGRFAGPRSGLRLTAGRLFSPANLRSPFRIVARSPGLLRLTLASLGLAAMQGGLFTFLTTYLADGLGLSLAFAGALYATMQGASVLGRICMGVIGDRVGSPRRTLVALSLASAAGGVGLTLIDGAWPAWLLFGTCGLAGAMIATWNGLFLAEVAATARRTGVEVSDATSASTFFTFLAYMATPLILAAVSFAFGYEAAFLLGSLAALGSALALVSGGRGGAR